MSNLFTIPEENIICIYKEDSRESVIQNIRDALPFMDSDMRELAAGVIGKLQGMTDADFAAAQFTFTEDESYHNAAGARRPFLASAPLFFFCPCVEH